ncbi:MAG: hypothetical protein GX982_06555, partial [Tissierellia bacterium]|nr:hypothetical protein [Tissierellia bacterium]
SNDKDTIEAYDFAFKIDTNFLNTNLLYVGSNKIAQDIYLETTKYIPDENKIKKLVYNYEDTFISFDEYLKTNGEINSDLEFLYFGSIKVSENDLY